MCLLGARLRTVAGQPATACRRPSTARAQDKLSAITARYLASAAAPGNAAGGGGGAAGPQQQRQRQQQQQQQQEAAAQLEAYIGECAALLGLHSADSTRSAPTSSEAAKEQLAEALEAVVLCKQPDCYG